ncbi:MAG: hypothetical protein GYA51_05620 [Candidatus Methanofastidiosa archaeon]|nr:hypothetical protein [Candidatus Methanofastidiosa archaeon]
MKKQLISLGAILLVCSLAMCINQAQIPDKFFESYGKIEATQTEIDKNFNLLWDQEAKRIEYVTKNKDNENIDHNYIISMLKSEQTFLDAINNNNANYSKQISGLYEVVKEVKGDEAKSKANDLTITLRKSEQYLGNAAVRYSSAINSIGKVENYYAIDANLSDPLIKAEIEAESLNAKSDFQRGDDFLGQYYLAKKEANATYQEILKMR